MAMVTGSLRRSDEPDSAGGWLKPALLTLAGLAFLGAIAWGIDSAIESYRDGIALRGLDGKPSPINLTVAGEALTIPANMIRFRADRRGGELARVSLLLRWPTLEGFSEDIADDFKDNSPDAPLIYVTIAARDAALDSTARLDTVYEHFFAGPVVPGPPGLVGRKMKADSPYAGEIVFFQPRGNARFVARCMAESTREMPSTCIRDVNFGRGLSMLYRFSRTRLADWRRLDAGLYALADSFLFSPH
jgi:hypothetical protein